MALTPKESEVLAGFLERLEWPLDSKVFRALCGITVTTPIELAVFNTKNEILLIYRKDEEYEGNHMPGTVLRDPETVQKAIKRLLNTEVGSSVTEPRSLGWVEVQKGKGADQDPNRHQIALLHACRLVSDYYKGKGAFYSLDGLPEDTLPHHRMLIEEAEKRFLR